MMEKTLIALGLALFFCGLASGVLIPKMKLPRMGVSSHLEGTANGTFLVVVGLMWSRVHLGDLWLTIAAVSLIFGAWANWAAIQLSAIWGTGKLTPIASGDTTGSKVHEGIVKTMLYGVAVTDFAGVAILFVGILR